MSDLATYTFLPWLRQGIANQINGTADFRATIPIDLMITGKSTEGKDIAPLTIHKDIQIYGPGDITGIDSKAIIKVEPRNWITNFEPNYLPFIEFYDEDLPWRYSPLPSPGNHRLTPWISLIVLKEDEFENFKNVKDAPLPSISLKGSDPTSFLPPPDQLSAWAHVHVNKGLMEDILSGNNTLIQEKLESSLNQNPDLAYSRLLCPRRLKEKTAYHAFLVPTFETGRKAGLGEDPTKVAAHQTAWNSTTAPDRIPYYYRWYFHTGTVGDFEYLVRLLEPKPVDSRVGVRDMDVQKPGANITGIRDEDLGGILKLGGALRVPRINYTIDELIEVEKYENWAQPYPHAFQESLAAFINLSNDYQNQSAFEANKAAAIEEDISVETPSASIYTIEDNPDPVITAPLYGQWHSLTNRLLKDQDNNPLPNNDKWIHELNLDPRWRVAAGFGTKVIQKNQEDYMKAAWDQVGDVLEAAKKIKAAQLARIVSQIYYKSHLDSIRSSSMEKWLALATPLSKRVLMGEATVHHTIKSSKLPLAALSVPMRKLLRPKGKLLKRIERISPENLINRLNSGEVTAAPPKTIPEGMNALEEIAKLLLPENLEKLQKGFQEVSQTYPQHKDLFGRLHEMLQYYMGNNEKCIDFPQTGRSPAPLQKEETVISVFDHEGRPLKYVEVVPWNPSNGMNAGFRTEVMFRMPVNSISLLFSNHSTPPTFLFENEAGEVIGKERPEGNDRAQNLNFNGESIIKLIIESPQNETLLHHLCYSYGTADENRKQQERNARAVLESSQASELVKGFPGSNNFRITTPGVTFQFGFNGEDNEEAREFKEALRDVNILFEKSAELGRILPKPSLNLGELSQNLFEKINPDLTIPRWIMGSVRIPDRIRLNLKEEFTEPMAYPEFDLPMYKPLLKVSEELFLPNLNYIAQNSISLLETNQKFIEAYMVGLNHEFARELLWREYPTDQRGSYFRQFWEVKDFKDDQNLDPKVLKEKLKDIPPIHLWSKSNSLGDHDNREAEGEKEQEVVLVVRGELLKKYPNAVIYAHRAQWQKDDDNHIDLKQERQLVPLSLSEQKNPPRSKIKTPLYEAKVDPDIYFFGFDLTACAAKGGSGKESDPIDPACVAENIPWDDPGWFFVIKERPGEPRFGLDIGEGTPPPPGHKWHVWNDLSWDHLSPRVAEGDFIKIAPTTPTISLTEPTAAADVEKKDQYLEDKALVWNKNMSSAELAYILYQVPVLVAVHASEMLPTN